MDQTDITESAEFRSLASRPRRASLNTLILVTYVASILVGATLVFLVQPIVTRMVLPLYGGAPAVWNTALVFFQALLLFGYGYSYLITRLSSLRLQMIVHAVVLVSALLVLPVALPTSAAPSDRIEPAFWLLFVLLVMVGLPYFATTTASPLIQRRFSQVDHPSASDPYWLYAAGNAGSLVALLGYPLVIEPYLPLSSQSWLWAGMYVLFIVLMFACMLVLLRYRASAPAIATSIQPGRQERAAAVTGPSWRDRLIWIGLAFIPSSLMIGVTNYLSTDIASAPMLWVVPLSLYLLTFVLAFSRRQFISPRVAAAALPVFVLASFIASPALLEVPIAVAVVLHLSLLFSAAMLAHGRLAQSRPDPEFLTEFYFLMSIGGVLGGIFNALVSPILFSDVYEYPLVIILALFLRSRTHDVSSSRWRGPLLDIALPALYAVVTAVGMALLPRPEFVMVLALASLLIVSKRPASFAVGTAFLVGLLMFASGSSVYKDRTFFGVLEVFQASDTRLGLAHGTTNHGVQDISSPDARRVPLAYYSTEGPLGDVFKLKAEPYDSVGVVGLGVGVVAAYGQEGQSITFYEIDPEVAYIAAESGYFSYLSDSLADTEIIIGDGRLKLADEPDQRFDVLILDAFSSDAIPTHLITREAVDLYFQKISPSGILAFHISNRYIDLEQVLGAISREANLYGLVATHVDLTKDQRDRGILPSKWVVLTQTPESVAGLEDTERWQRLGAHGGGDLWTDDYTNLIGVIDWFD